ncbi:MULTISPECIES: TetR/AcrR family transcriptional regulator [Actinosynnema]|uniref:TetR/AcrR family transcriptional regulator n=1 Tax=Actinosynnema TaxID=40566 RepID=UPI002646CC4A|nr:TetR/AcrR family transcriptional regulator [Actinosynnema pretiosum]MCP2096584.1 transcriptional regulator, TetR family [Actinosynnema pretiosum]
MPAVPEPSARTRLLDAAATLLAASTSGDVSTREVCEAAGVKPPTLYHHFGDKDGLLHAVVVDGFERYLASKRALPPTGDVITDFRRGWDRHVEFAITNPALYNVMYGRPLAGAEPTPAAARARADLAAMLQALHGTGRLRLPVDVAASTCEAAAVGVALHLVRTGGPLDDPAATVVREAVITALLGPVRAYADAPVAPDLAATAARLRDALPDGPLATLRASETALLRDWLGDLAAAPTTASEGETR